MGVRVRAGRRSNSIRRMSRLRALRVGRVEGAADFAVAIAGEDAGHVGVQVGSFVADADEGHGETDMVGPVEGAGGPGRRLVGDDEGGVGFGFEVGFVPDVFLDFDAAWKSGRLVHCGFGFGRS